MPLIQQTDRLCSFSSALQPLINPDSSPGNHSWHSCVHACFWLCDTPQFCQMVTPVRRPPSWCTRCWVTANIFLLCFLCVIQVQKLTPPWMNLQKFDFYFPHIATRTVFLVTPFSVIDYQVCHNVFLVMLFSVIDYQVCRNVFHLRPFSVIDCQVCCNSPGHVQGCCLMSNHGAVWADPIIWQPSLQALCSSYLPVPQLISTGTRICIIS